MVNTTYVAMRLRGVRWALAGGSLLGLLLELLDSFGVLQVVGELQTRNGGESKSNCGLRPGCTYGSLILAVHSVVGTFLSVLKSGVAGRVVVGLGRTGLEDNWTSARGNNARTRELTVGSMAPSLLDILLSSCGLLGSREECPRARIRDTYTSSYSRKTLSS